MELSCFPEKGSDWSLKPGGVGLAQVRKGIGFRFFSLYVRTSVDLRWVTLAEQAGCTRLCTIHSSYAPLKEAFYLVINPAYRHTHRENSWLKSNNLERNQDNLDNSATMRVFPSSLEYISPLPWLSARSWQGLHSDGSKVLRLANLEVRVMKQICPAGKLAFPTGTSWLWSVLLQSPAPWPAGAGCSLPAEPVVM